MTLPFYLLIIIHMLEGPVFQQSIITNAVCFFISGVIGVLVESGRPIDAINLAYAFELTEQFEPVQLLKAYLRDVKKVSHAKNVKMSLGAQVNFSHFNYTL